MRFATLDVHSGEAKLRHEVRTNIPQPVTETDSAPFKIGTWATFELGPLN